MRARAASVLSALVLLLAAAPALAQDGNPFNGLPPAEPTPAPTATPAADTSNDDVGRATLYIIAGALLVAFVGIGWWIARDARRTLPPEERDRLGRPADPDRLPHRHERQAKAKARAKGRAQRQARKAGRKARR
jgi:hypothetical protein